MTTKHSNTVSKILAAAVLVAASAGSQQALGETNRLCAKGENSNCYLTGNFPIEIAAAAGLVAADDAALTVRFIDGEWSMGGVLIGSFGGVGWTPIVGDWDGDGHDNIGVYNNGMWIFKNSWNFVDAGYDITMRIYGDPSWTPIVGNWSGDDKVDTLGLYKNGEFKIRLDSDDAASEEIITFELPLSGDHKATPIAGAFDDNEDLVGIVQDSTAMFASINLSAYYELDVGHPDLVRGGFNRPITAGEKQPIVMPDSLILLSKLPSQPVPVRCPLSYTAFCEWIDVTTSIGVPNDGGRTDIPTPQPFSY